MRQWITLGLLGLMLCAASRVSAQTIEDIRSLAQNGINEDVILASVQQSKTAFTLSAADILKLKEAKVSDKVIAAMLRHKPAVNAAEAVTPVISSKPAILADGVLSIENVDDKTWSYMYDSGTQTVWISPAAASGQGNIGAHAGVSLRMRPGTYNLRYSGQNNGPAVTVFAGGKSLVMLTRVENAQGESLYVSLFERGERRNGGKLAVLREATPAEPKDERSEAPAPAPAPQVTERVIERERIVEAPPATTVIYRDPVVYTYAPPVIYTPYYCAPRYYYPGNYARFGYSSGYRHHSHTGVSIGVGIGF